MRWNLLSPTTSNAEAGPSKLSTQKDAAAAVPTVNRYEGILKDEERYQELQYPTTEEVPGCMTLFDEFMMCYGNFLTAVSLTWADQVALVPQLRSFYRHGEFRDCTWKFQDFKYCLSLKSEDPEVKRRLWIKRRAEWWAARRAGASSEDVWDIRTEPLENFPPLHQEEIPLDQTAT